MSLVLVTGATGFIGRALMARLESDGRAFRAALRVANPAVENAAVVGEIGPGTDWTDALDGVDAVIHLAGRAHVMARESNALAQFRRVNVAGVARLAEQAASRGVKRFILISSVKAAADSSGDAPLTEAGAPAPGTPYGLSKLEGERALLDRAGGMETVILRPPLVYGPQVKANLRALLRLIDSGLPLPLGSVRNRRSLVARDNLVDAMVMALESRGAAGGVFHVTDGQALSTPDLIRGLATAMGRPARLFPFPPALLSRAARAVGKADAADSLLGSLALDDSAFRARTGWTPPVSQEAAFRAVAAWYRARTASEP